MPQPSQWGVPSRQHSTSAFFRTDSEILCAWCCAGCSLQQPPAENREGSDELSAALALGSPATDELHACAFSPIERISEVLIIPSIMHGRGRIGTAAKSSSYDWVLRRTKRKEEVTRILCLSIVFGAKCDARGPLLPTRTTSLRSRFAMNSFGNCVRLLSGRWRCQCSLGSACADLSPGMEPPRIRRDLR